MCVHVWSIAPGLGRPNCCQSPRAVLFLPPHPDWTIFKLLTHQSPVADPPFLPPTLILVNPPRLPTPHHPTNRSPHLSFLRLGSPCSSWHCKTCAQVWTWSMIMQMKINCTTINWVLGTSAHAHRKMLSWINQICRHFALHFYGLDRYTPTE